MSIYSLFYLNETGANNNYYYYLNDILMMNDYLLEKDEIYFDWLFPDRKNLSDHDIKPFKTNKIIRKNVLKAVFKLLDFYGFRILRDGKVEQIRPLKRKRNEIFVGLYSMKQYKRITRILDFLNRVNMEKVSSLFMLCLCQAMKTDLELRRKIEESGELSEWIKTQSYLSPFKNKFKMKVCRFTGLKYTGNSCYQDSTLLALFAKPNDFITTYILESDLNKLNREIVCSDDHIEDHKIKSSIQKELIRITKSMRKEVNESEKVEYCSGLRRLLRKCPGQDFYSTSTQDAGEFLQYIFGLFRVEGMFKNTKVIVTNELSNKVKNYVVINEKVQQSSPIVLIPAHSIRKGKIDSYLNQTEDAIFDSENLYRGPDNKKYKRRIEKNSVVFANYLVFYVQRLLTEEERIYEKILPVQSIRLPEMYHDLELSAIVVHRSNHYTTYIKCDDNWYYYNDMSQDIVSIGSYEDMLKEKTRPNVCKEGILYFYN